MPLETLADLRNRIFASRRFQDAAAAIPGMRGVANRRAAQLFDLTAGFVYSQVLFACVELDLFRRLEGGPAPVATLASEARLPEEAMARLGKAAAALGLLELRKGERLALGPQGAALLGNPSVFEMVRHHRMLFEDLADPVGMLRAPKGQTRLGAFWSYAANPGAAELPESRTDAYSALMAATQAFIADEVTGSYRFSRHREVLDIGGGTGAFLCAVGRAAPKAKLTLFDLPSVAARAGGRFETAGLSARATAVGGDFRSGALPQGADLVTLVRVLHDHDDADAQALLRSVYKALPVGGRVLIAEPMAGTGGAAPMGDAYFGIYLWAMGRGAPRTAETLKSMLAESGFSHIRSLRNRRPLLTRMILAEKSAVTDG